jgi:hypothetical protein
MTRTRAESSGSGGWWSSACTAMALHHLKFLVRERLSWRWKASGSKLGRLWCHWSERLERDGPSWPDFGHRRRFLLELCKDKEDGARKRPSASPAAAAISFPQSTSSPRFSTTSSRRRAHAALHRRRAAVCLGGA